MIFRPQVLRRWAAHVAFLWLFGLVMGVANACMAYGANAAAMAAAPDERATAAQAGQPEATPAALPACHGHGGDADGAVAKTNCQDFCEKAAAASPVAKASLDDLQLQAAFVASVAVGPPVSARSWAPAWAPHTVSVPAPPIRLAFPRLSV